jgi:hypothetical protein
MIRPSAYSRNISISQLLHASRQVAPPSVFPRNLCNWRGAETYLRVGGLSILLINGACRRSGSFSPVYHRRGGQGSLPGQVMCNLWCTEWYCGGFCCLSHFILIPPTAPHSLTILPSTPYSLVTSSFVKERT